jgi:two-component system sensor kinase FixL
MLGELSGAYAHELTQPLTAVLSNAQAAQRVLERETPDLDSIREMLADIVAADMRASNVIRGLRPMLMKGQTSLSEVDINQLMYETHKLARADLNARDVRLVARPQAGLPEVLGDRVQLQQVLLNLLINACDAMQSTAHMQRKVHMSTYRSKDGMVGVSITDFGPGIAPAVMNRIFNPFVTSKENGLGLGLSICRSIAVAHRGRLWAVNNEKQGATFYLELPPQDAAHPVLG